MLKPLVITAMLCAPAIADSSMQLSLQLRDGANLRNHVIALADGTCSKIEDKTPDHRDEIKACAKVEGANVRLELMWSTDGAKTSYRNESTVVLARGGGITLGKPDAKLLVKLD